MISQNKGAYFMKVKHHEYLLFLICFTLLFINIPKHLQMSFIGGPVVGCKLVLYPLIICMLYTVWCDWKYKDVLVYKRELGIFVSVYVCITFISLITGLAYYPYFGEIINGPVSQIEKLPKVLRFLNNIGVSINAETLLPLWMIARMIKGLFLEIIYTFMATYMFYCCYCSEWREAFRIVIKAILCSLGVLFIFSFFIEVPYLAGNEIYMRILETINPLIHSIKDDGKWWPPLLWPGQLRSVFAEPSYFGIYTAFAMPFLWYLVYKDRKILGSILTLLLTFLLFLTKARTGFMLFLGEIVLLLLFGIIFAIDRDYFKKTGLIILTSLVAFVSSNYFISTCMNKENQNSEANVTVAMTAYIDSNATSLANPDKRSNRARYSIMEADFRIGLDHPILGVGRGLRDGYIPQYLPEKGKQNGEVKMWLDYREKLGILKSGFPSLGEYTVRFGETGILGLLAFLAPVLFLIFNMIKKLKDNTFQYKLEYGMFLIALLGIMASGIGDSLNITYCYWVLLGLGYAMCFGKTGDEKDINERT